MQRHTFLYFIIIHFLGFASFGQGFYNNEDVFVNSKTLNDESICIIQGYSDYQNISNRTLSNFVFKYEINKNGGIEKRTYWQTPFISKKIKKRWYDDRFMAVSLVKDSIVYIDAGILSYMQCAQSSIYEYDQFKSNTEQQMEEMSNQIQFNDLHSNKYEIRIKSGEDYNLLIDTSILGHLLCIPKLLLKSNDSICIKTDSVISFYYMGVEKHKFSITDSSTIKVEWLNNDGIVWRTYLFNQEGLLYKQTQGIITTKYFYENKLHIKTETYQKDYLMQTTTFEYKKECG
jgi:hypothetical protein